jgi:cobalamin biosynthesis protein CobD/CbiB
VGEIPMANEIDKLGPKDFFMGCLVIVLAIFVVPILVLLFKVSIYLAIFIGVIVAIVLGTALLGKIIRLIFFREGPDGKNNIK